MLLIPSSSNLARPPYFNHDHTETAAHFDVDMQMDATYNFKDSTRGLAGTYELR
jgi:hypothetical protein